MRRFPVAEFCNQCKADVPTEWVPAVFCGTRALPGTGIRRSQLLSGLCPNCYAFRQAGIIEARKQTESHLKAVSILGGEKPLREFRFENFEVTPQNREAFLRAKSFNEDRENLYLWGPCGVGKTHLAMAIAAQKIAIGRYVCVHKPPQLLRRVRRMDPDDEQRAIDRIIRADVFILDDLGIGNETAYARQSFQEILDGRDFAYRAGLVVTSKYSLDNLARKLEDDTIPSRLAGLCSVIKVEGPDRRSSKKI